MNRPSLSLVLASALGATVLGASGAVAAPENYSIDTVHSQILFFVDHVGFSKSEGEFLEYRGRYTFDRENWGASSVKVEIDTPGIEMDDAAWNKHLKSADFFNVEKFPKMTFASTRVEKTGENTGRMQGNLTLLGVTRPVTVDFTFNKAAEFPLSEKFKSGFSGTTRFKRSDFGMTHGVAMGIGDEVEVRLEIEGFRE